MLLYIIHNLNFNIKKTYFGAFGTKVCFLGNTKTKNRIKINKTVCNVTLYIFTKLTLYIVEATK